MNTVDVHILHDVSGRILAIAPAGGERAGDGTQRGVTPVAGPGQFALRLSLGQEHAAIGPVALIRDYEIEVGATVPGLRPRTSR